MRPDPRLHNRPRAVFECYGKPHIGAFYANGRMDSHKLEEGARCACCGKPATNAHHWPPRSKGLFEHHGHILRPSLIALCGSGTTGCHGAWHGARFKALWMWDTPKYAQEWLDGYMLDEIEPHSPELYRYGCWEVYDASQSRIWQVREL